MLSRRNFCKTCGLLSVTGALAPSFLAQTVVATAAGQGNKALVVLQMTGGNDGLNTLVPYADSAYHNARPTLALTDSQLLKLDNNLALNSSMKPLFDMYNAGQVAIMRGVGYPNPNYSHFRSMEIWQSSNPDGPASDGWLGRYLEEKATSGDQTALNRLGMTIGNTGQGGGAPLAFWTEKTQVLSYAGSAQFQFKADASIKTDRDAQLKAARAIYGATNANSLATYVSETALDALSASDALSKLSSTYKPGVTYPNTQFASRLQNIAEVLSSDFGSRVFYVSTDGSFDTHFNQAYTQPRLLQEMSEGLSAFYQDLAAHGLADSVLTMTFSEFGRRVEENGSHGTDHGSAAPMFVLGGKNAIKGGMYGQQPSLTDLDAGNMRQTTDFRSVYSTIMKNWLGADPTPVVGGSFPLLNFV